MRCPKHPRVTPLGSDPSLRLKDDLVDDAREEGAEVGHELGSPFSSMHCQRCARAVTERDPSARARGPALVGDLFTRTAALDAPLVLGSHASRDDLPVVRANHNVAVALDRVRVALGLERHRNLPGQACLVHHLGLVEP